MGLPDLTQDDEPRQSTQEAADNAALENYMSSPSGEGSLMEPLGGAAPAPAGGSMTGMGALMLPLLMAQMQQRQQAVSPLGAFANAYAAAQGRPQPVAPQAAGAGPMQMLAVMKAMDEAQHRQRSDLLNQKKYDETLKSNALREENIRGIIQNRQRAGEQSQDQMLLKMLETVDTSKPGGAEMYGNEMARIANRLGVAGVQPDFFRQKINLTAEQRKDIEVMALGVAEGSLQPQDVMAKYPSLPPDYLASTVKMMQNPLLRKAAGIPSDEDLRGHAAEIARKQMDAWAQPHGYATSGAEEPKLLLAADYFRGKTGRAIYQADEKDPQDLAILGQAKQYAEQQFEARHQKLRLEKREDEDRHNRNIIDRQLAAEGRQPVANKSVIDKTTGILMTPTKAEWAANPSRYRFPTGSEEQQLTYLTTAIPNIRSIGQLVDRILVDKGPDNLINALQGNIGAKMGTDTNWRALNTLLSDTNVEITRALGQGQFRTQLLDYIKKANITGRDTREVSHAVLNIMENQIENRRQSIISGGDMAALKAAPLPENPVSKTIRARKIGTKGPIISAPAGTPLPPGYEAVP